jgi:DNA helicase-2/ATP-dependent DNA helicase PcrA
MSLPKIEKLWELKKFSPNPQQKEAILHDDGPLFLSAGPGSGKTRVLLWRTLNLMAYKGVKAEEIFLSTFTEKAAFQLKEGLRSLLGLVSQYSNQSYDLSKMAIGTVHSICSMIITDRRFTDGNRVAPPILMDELSQYFHLYNRFFWSEIVQAGEFDDEENANREINDYLGNRNSSSRHNAVTNLISLFNRFSEECLVPSEVKTKDKTLKKLLKMYEYYLKSLIIDHRIRNVDFSLLQQRAFETIEKSKNAHKIYKYVVIDEYQDTNHIQEKIFFSLAKGNKNICIVGDDDQALYRFRGATVENLVEFEQRCKSNLGTKPHKIDLVKNYRSRKQIVHHYSDFIDRIDWKKEKPAKGFHRITKKIDPHNTDERPSVLVSTKGKPEDVYEEIALFVQGLKESGKVEDYNQVAFLFPAMKGITKVTGFQAAFENLGIPVYAPRAGRFLEVVEARAIWGLLIKIFGKPVLSRGVSGGLRDFLSWVKGCDDQADWLIEKDPQLRTFIKDKKEEIDLILNDFEILTQVITKKKWNLNDDFKLEMIREFIKPTTLSKKAKNNLTNKFFNNAIERKLKEGKPYKIKYILNRVTSVDWSVLDLFYQLNGFDHFREMYVLAEDGSDEGPICNLGLITQYLARFMEQYTPIITASFLSENKFVNTFFTSYTYALFRLSESEYEDADDPFPKGRVPFLTIHQAKGLEFPVVVMGSLYKMKRGPQKNEEIIRELLNKEGEPLERMNEFDVMRMFYVGLSRAQNLLVLPRYKGTAAATDQFKEIFEENNLIEIKDFKSSTLPKAKLDDEDLGKNYSYTGDYLQYYKCPRNYMIFKKYGFVPSRSQTMFFGSLIHQTIEDLHHLLIQEKTKMVS